MPVNDDLGNRMKTFYEQVSKARLVRRMPVIIRIDGKAFHTFTRGFQKPFDELLLQTMQETTKYLCENVQGCVLGYTQSDEITLVLVDYKKLNSAAWFDYEVQKMCSIAASMATMAFNKIFHKIVIDEICKGAYVYSIIYERALKKGAMFDARCFNIPKEEVTNCIYWRQLDASRNSIQMVGQANFSHKELQNKSCSDIQDMLMTQRGVNWNDLPTYLKRGSCVIKKRFFEPNAEGHDFLDIDGSGEPVCGTYRTHCIIDTDIPIFKGEGRKYIDRLVYVGEQ